MWKLTKSSSNISSDNPKSKPTSIPAISIQTEKQYHVQANKSNNQLSFPSQQYVLYLHHQIWKWPSCSANGDDY